MMNELIERFMDQLEEGIQIGRSASIRPASPDITHIYVAGLGGSGIGADFVSSFIEDECKLPFLVRKGYHVPAFVGPKTLAIASSYSGNTEETLISYAQMKEQGARLLCVASGGKIIDLAKADGNDFIQVPGNWPSPRACLGYSVAAQIALLQHLGLISDRCLNEMEGAVKMLRQEASSIRDIAKGIAAKLHNRIPIIYIEDRMEPVAVRLRQQINENSKALCWHHVIPEMNHNELVGWTEENKDLVVLYLRNDDDYPRNAVRMDINKEIIGKYAGEVVEVYSKGANFIEKSLYLVHLGDWISWELSVLRNVDALEVNVIDYLKGELAKV